MYNPSTRNFSSIDAQSAARDFGVERSACGADFRSFSVSTCLHQYLCLPLSCRAREGPRVLGPRARFSRGVSAGNPSRGISVFSFRYTNPEADVLRLEKARTEWGKSLRAGEERQIQSDGREGIKTGGWLLPVPTPPATLRVTNVRC
jgi:hypothetical protein